MSSEKTQSYEKFSIDDGRRVHDEHGYELPDDTPMAPPVGYTRQPSLAEQIRQMVRSERLRQEAEEMGMETFEEADDFEIGDDYDPTSPYEEHFDPTPVKELKKRKEKDEASPPSPPPKPLSKSKLSGDQPDSGTEEAKLPESGEAD